MVGGLKRKAAAAAAVMLLCTVAFSVIGQGTAAAASGRVMTFGDGGNGALGTGATDDSSTPVRAALTGTAVDVAAGSFHTVVALADGTVHTWGSNLYGQQATGVVGGPVSVAPHQVTFPTGTVVVAVEAGAHYSLALDSTGQVWRWGSMTQNNDHSDSFTAPRLVDSLAGVASIAAGNGHALAVLSNGELWSWGQGVAALGSSGGTPTAAAAVPDLGGVTSAAAGFDHSLAVTTNGYVYTWGGNTYGQLGTATDAGAPATLPVLVREFGGIDVAAGTHHSLLLLDTGEVQATGRNDSGQLGDGTTTDRTGFETLAGLPDVRDVGNGDYSSFAIDTDGVLHGWGSNREGQLGPDSSGGLVTTPQAIAGLADVGDVDSGFSHTVAMEADPRLANLTIDVVPAWETAAAPPDSPAGITDIPTAEFDLADLPLSLDEMVSAPLRSSPLRSSPLRSSPLRSSPLRSSPLRSSPLRSSPLRSSPLRSSPLRSSPVFQHLTLADVQLSATTYPDGWAPLLENSPFEGLPLQTVLLQPVLALGDDPGSAIAGISLADIDLESTPLRSSSIQAFLLAGPSLDEISPTKDWCADLGGTFCADHGIAEATSTLLDVEAAGGSLSALGVSSLPVSAAALSEAIIADYDVGSVAVGITQYGSLPATHTALTTIVDCSDATVFDCSDATSTLTAAVEGGHILDGGVLRPLLEDDTATGWMTLGRLVSAVVDPSKFSFSDLSLDDIVAAAPLETTNAVQYQVAFDARCDEVDSSGELTASVELPVGFRYLGTSTLSMDGGAAVEVTPFRPIYERVVLVDGDSTTTDGPVGEQHHYAIGGTTGCEGSDVNHYVLSLDVQPGADLGVHTASASVSTANAWASTSGAPLRIVEANEPNEGKAAPSPIAPGELVLSHISHGDDVDYFELPAQPLGTTVTFVLGPVPADFDLAVVDGPEGAPLRSSPLRSSPLRSSPLRSSPLRSSPIEDAGLDGEGGADTVAADTLQDAPLRSSPLRSSPNRGTATEVVTGTVFATGQPVTIAVAGYNGARSNRPYVLQAIVDEPPTLNCPTPRAFTGGVQGTLPATLDAGVENLIIVNSERFSSRYPGSMDTGNPDSVRSRLDALAARPDVNGAVLAVDGAQAVRDAYTGWDAAPCSPEAANAVVKAINDVVDSYRPSLPNLESITVVGDDDMVPFARVPDLVTLSNQRDYFADARFGGVDNPISAAFAHSMVLSDNAYGDLDPIDWLGHSLLVPDIAVGRLVENPTEIEATITQFVASGGAVSIGDSLSAGYDFLADGAQVVDDTFTGKVGAGANALIDDTWDRTALKTALDAGPDVSMVGAHFDHSNALPAAADSAASFTKSDLFTSGDLAAAAMPLGAVMFTPGCNSGVNIPDFVAGATPDQIARLTDFAQTMAAEGGAGFVANLGYGYGDTDLVAYSERQLDLYAQYLFTGNTLGEALVQARSHYLGELPLPSVYDEKVAVEATFYGFPFTRIADGLGAPPPAPAPLAVVDDGAASYSDFHYDAAALTPTPMSGDNGTWYEVGGHQPLAVPYRPVQPTLPVELATPTGSVVGGVWFTALSSTDGFVADPSYVRPIVDDSSREVEPEVDDVAFPASLASVTLDSDVVLLPGSFRSDGSGAGSGSQRLYSEMAGRVYFAQPGDPVPMATRVEAVEIAPDSTAFTAEIDGADIAEVLYQVAGDPVWHRASLNQTAPGWWAGHASADVAEYFVQFRKGGQVGSARGKGLNYVPSTMAVPGGGIDIGVSPAATADGWHASPATVTVAGADGVVYELSINGGPFTPAAAPVALDTGGVHTVDVRGSDGSTARRLVPVEIADTVPPEIGAVGFSPASPVPVGQPVTVTAPVGDAVTASLSFDGGTRSMSIVDGVASIVLDAFATPGVHPVRVEASDASGNSTISEEEMLVVYDGNGGFVTGGGWIHSPAGALAGSPDAEGRANFGFVSKYAKGAVVPTGDTQFRFKAGSFEFESELYEWLVVSGARAQYKGTGKVNGTPGFGFLLTASDSAVTGGGSVDGFRIKVWDKVTGAIVYDNRVGQTDGINASLQPISGGSIVIHKSK